MQEEELKEIRKMLEKLVVRLEEDNKRFDARLADLQKRATQQEAQGQQLEERSGGVNERPGQQNGSLVRLGQREVGIQDFGAHTPQRFSDKVLRKLQQAEDKAIEQVIDYAKAGYVVKAAQQEIDEMTLNSLLSQLATVDRMNKWVAQTDTLSPQQKQEFYEQIQRYQEQSGQTTELGREALQRKLLEHITGLPGFSFFD